MELSGEGGRWTAVSTWYDGAAGEDDVEFGEMCPRLLEELALISASERCRAGKQNYSREDDPRLRDASALIEEGGQTEELEGFLEAILQTGDRPGIFALPGVLLSFQTAMNEAWAKLSEDSKAQSKLTHAVLGPAWHADERLTSFTTAMVAAWKQVLLDECEATQTAPPSAVLAALQGFEPLLKDLGKENGVFWSALHAAQAVAKEQTDASQTKVREAAKARFAKLVPGVNCCYECEEDDHEEEYAISEGVADLVWAKEQEGFKYSGEDKPDKILFCEVCFEDFQRY